MSFIFVGAWDDARNKTRHHFISSDFRCVFVVILLFRVSCHKKKLENWIICATNSKKQAKTYSSFIVLWCLHDIFWNFSFIFFLGKGHQSWKIYFADNFCMSKYFSNQKKTFSFSVRRCYKNNKKVFQAI